MATIRKRVGAKGTRYNAIVRRDGHVQSATFRTKSEAQKWAARTEAAIAEGKHLPSSASKRKTVKDLLERYKRSEIPKKRDRANPIRYAEFWIGRLGNLRLHQLTPAAIVEIRDELEIEKSAATVNRYLANLSHACTMAVVGYQPRKANKPTFRR